MTFSYDGTDFIGFQKQPKGRTIQAELENALTKLNSNHEVSIVATGRTDAGVHALNQKAHFDLIREYDDEYLRNSLNKMIPEDIYVKTIEKVDLDFHARYNVKAKEYIYRINLGEYNPLERNYVYQYNKRLDLSEMERALKYLEGTHNFKSFTKATAEIKDYERTINQATLVRNEKNLNEIVISLIGDGFLRYMVRNIVGLLIEIGEGKRKSEEVYEILKLEDRTEAGLTAPACGLYLKDVFY
jgi:tRNA pseudouridine38-40 synthase